MIHRSRRRHCYWYIRRTKTRMYGNSAKFCERARAYLSALKEARWQQKHELVHSSRDKEGGKRKRDAKRRRRDLALGQAERSQSHFRFRCTTHGGMATCANWTARLWAISHQDIDFPRLAWKSKLIELYSDDWERERERENNYNEMSYRKLNQNFCVWERISWESN